MVHCNVFLSLFVVFTVLNVTYPNEVQGYEILDYNPAVAFYKYPWQGLIPRKSMRTEQSTEVPDGGYLVNYGDNWNNDNRTIVYTKKAPAPNNNMAVLNRVQKSFKVLYGRIPGTITFWPSTD